MELEDMQAAWSQMSQQLEKQQQLTDDIIMKMTKQRYQNNWSKIATTEKIGFVVCYAIIIAILFNFHKLDTFILQLSGGLSILILGILPILSLKIIKDLQRINIVENSYKETLEAYVKNKKRFINFQKISISMSLVFGLLFIPVFMKLLRGKNIFELTSFNVTKILLVTPFVFLLMFLFIYYVTKWFKHLFKNAEAILEDIKE